MPTSPSEHVHRPGLRESLPSPGMRVACVSAMVAALAAAPLSAVAGAPARLLAAALTVVVFAFCVVLVGRRAARPAADQRMWRWLAAGTVVLGLGAVVESGLGAAAALSGSPALPSGAALLVTLIPTVGCVWGSLVHRQTTRHDRGEWLNAVAGLFLIAAAALLLLSLVAPETYHAVPSWRLHLSALLCGALFTTVVAMVAMGLVVRGLARIAMWSCAASLLPLLVLVDVFGLTGSGTWLLQLFWTLPVVLVAGVATLPEQPLPAPLRRVPSTWIVLILIGQSVVLLGLAALAQRLGAFDADHPPLAPVLFALAGSAAISGRGVRLVRDLASLAENRQLAVTDELTGLGNRRSLLRGLEKLTRSAW